jgi:hypothetical protein
MTLFLAWVVFPIVLSLLSLGCGLLLETASGMRLPGALLLPGGFIVISIATYFAHMSNATAPLQTPLVILLSVTGYALSPPWKRFQFDGWLAGAAVGVFWVFAAPVVLAGATFAGYIKLDDTATFLAFLDRAANHGYGAAGLIPSTYKSTLLQEGYKYGYPLGSMLPLDIGHTLLRVDQAWLWQPYLTFMAALTALGLYELVSGLVQSRMLRACVAFFGAQAALIYGYALWGGVKELFGPAALLFAICLVPRVKTGTPRQAIALGAASAAVIGALSVGGGIWLVPMLVAGVTLLVVYRSLDDVLKTVGVYAVTTLALSLPILYVSESRVKVLGKFLKTGNEGSGNLNHALSWWHLAGIWLAGDFRNRSLHPALAHLIAILIVVAAIFAVVMAYRRRRWEILIALATGVFACLVYVEEASPWVAGKALASASPLVLGVGLAGAAVVVETGRRIEGGVLLVVMAAAVLWSNTLQYHAVLTAPSARLMELEKIGSKFSGKGPALLTEYEPYSVRHFLRGLDAENTSGLRFHFLCLQRPGVCSSPSTQATNGSSPDIDEIRLDQVLLFNTLITRRSGVGSRPPSSYSLAWSGRYYDVWRKNPGPNRIIQHLSLGSRLQPAARPACKTVTAIAARAASAHGVLATVIRPEATVLNRYGQSAVPRHFFLYGEPPGLIYKTNKYRLNLPFTVRTDGTYGVWVGGSFSSTLTAAIDGHRTGQQRNQTEWPGNFLNFGSAHLTPGKHMLVIKHSGPDWRPGTAAKQPFGLGPFVVAQGTDDQNVTIVKPSNAHSLCGKSLDWIEALRG